MSERWVAAHVVDGKYRLEERLGEGALGAVFRAVHLGLEKSFAIKLLKTAGEPSSEALARFRREAVALGRLRHPHIVDVTDSGGDESGAPYLVMELLDGAPLSDLCRQGPLPLAQALLLLEEIASAVDAAHEAGILHRDLKPGNVFLCAEDAGPARVKVLDFGLAELLARPGEAPSALPSGGGKPAPDLTASGALPGTPLYAAPELIRNAEASRATDIYSFGVLAYELLGGKPPFQGTMEEVLVDHLEGEPPVLPLFPAVWRVLREALEKDPSRRPASAGEAVRRLRQAAAQAEQAAWRAAEIPRRALLAALLATALTAAGLAFPGPLFPALERWIGDLRVRTAPAIAPDPRILLVTLYEPGAEKIPLSMAERADEIGGTLDRVFEAGARGVALDLQLPAAWSASPAFTELLLTRSPDLTLAVFSDRHGRLVGTECVDELTAAALGWRRTSEIFGFVNLDDDPDGAVRKGRLRFLDRSGVERPSWAARAARGLGVSYDRQSRMPSRFWIDTRIDWRRYQRISWRELLKALDREPDSLRGRLVLVGWDFEGSGDDYHRVPQRASKSVEVSGLALQALMADTIGAGLPIREAAWAPVLAATVFVIGFAMGAILCLRRTGWLLAGLAVTAGFYLALSFPAFWWRGLILPATSPGLLVLLGTAAAFVLRWVLVAPPEPAP